jgi:hypothetical protein
MPNAFISLVGPSVRNVVILPLASRRFNESLRLTRVRGVPLASEALGFTEVVRRHLVCNSVASFDGAFSILTGHS